MNFLRVAIAAFSALILAGVAGVWFGADPAPPPSAGQVAATQKLLALRLPDTMGKSQAMNQWSGQVVVINYWATWCAPCREEMPAFSRLSERFAANGVQFVGISIDSVDKVIQFQTDTPVSYPLLIGSASSIDPAVDLGNPAQGLPFTVVLDRNGKVAATKLGRYAESDLEAQIKRLL